MPVPLDEYPIHQVPLSMRYAGTSDRNFYDRCYFNAHDRTGDVFLITGLGVYPNLGVVDAYAVARKGDRQWSVRCSDAIRERGLGATVGPYRVEVQEPLNRIRVVCDTPDRGLAFDLTWEGSFDCIDEPRRSACAASAGGCPVADTCPILPVGSGPVSGSVVAPAAAGKITSTVGSEAGTARGGSGPRAKPSRPVAPPTSPARGFGGFTCR